MAKWSSPEVETPSLAWLASGEMPPLRLKVVPFHVPLVAMSTAPGGVVRELSQQAGTAPASVEGMGGVSHQVAVRSETPPSTEETICHGGTWRLEGLEMISTPLERVPVKTLLLEDFWPRAATLAWMSAGPPLLTI